MIRPQRGTSRGVLHLKLCTKYGITTKTCLSDLIVQRSACADVTIILLAKFDAHCPARRRDSFKSSGVVILWLVKPSGRWASTHKANRGVLSAGYVSRITALPRRVCGPSAAFTVMSMGNAY